MIFHLTRAAAESLNVSVPDALPAAENPFRDWHVHRFRLGRKSFLMISNSASMYTMVIPARGITDAERFRREALDRLQVYLSVNGNGGIFERFIAPYADIVQFSRAVNRRVLGSMNLFIGDAACLEYAYSPIMFELSDNLNDTPMTLIKYQLPCKAFRSLAANSGQAPDHGR